MRRVIMGVRGRRGLLVEGAPGEIPRAPALPFPNHTRQARVARAGRPRPGCASTGGSRSVPPAPLPSIFRPPPHPALRQRVRAAGRRKRLRLRECKMTIQTIQLNKLALSDLNVRKVNPKEIDAIAADIQARGVMHNLIDSDEDGKLQI